MRRQRLWARLALTTAAGATVLAAVGCSNPMPGTPGDPVAIGHPNLALASALQPFTSCDDVLSNLKAQADKRVTAYGLPSTGVNGGVAVPDTATAAASGGGAPTPAPKLTGDAATGSGSGSASTPAAGESAAPTHSGTNVQEKGVDEPDTTKTDGKRLYTIQNGTLYVFTIDGGIPTQAGKLSLAGSSDQQLLLSGDKLLVLRKGTSTRYSTEPPIVSERAAEDGVEAVPPSSTSDTQLVEIDASDPADPKASSQIAVDGSIVDARMVNGTARIVIDSDPTPLSFVRPTSSTAKGRQRAIDANRRIIDDSTIDDWVPTYSIEGSSDRRPLVDCANMSRPKQFGGFGTVTVMSVTIGQGINPRSSVSVQADADKVYATADRLFVSTNRLTDPADSGDGGTATGTVSGATAPTTARNGGIACDPACPPPSTSTRPTTPQPPSSAPDDPDYRTSIHEFGISGTGPATYEASGEVRGHLLNDFAMSDDSGYLRLATTDGAPWSRSSSSVQTYVSVLHEEDGELKQIGQVGGMGHGEQIRSVRFIGSMGYVVTFKQTDPLYTVDIRDPHHPKVAGELSLLGYSAYLHPVANGLIMGVGQDATSQGRALGTQVTLFDVSNPSHPELVQKVAMPGGSSTVEQDYHAFLWWDPSHLAFIPVQQYGGVARTQPACMPDSPCAAEADAPTAAFVGVVGMTVDSSGIHETGRIVNPGATTPGIPECPPDADCATSGSSGSSGTGGTVGTAVVPPSIATTSTTVPSDPEVRTACEASGQCATTTSSTPTTAPTSSTEPELTAPSTTMRCDPACPKPTDPPSTSTSTSQAPGSSTSSSSASSSTTVATPAPSTTLRPVPSIPAGGGAPIDRTVVVGDHVLTVSAGGIVVSDLGDLAPITWVPFA